MFALSPSLLESDSSWTSYLKIHEKIMTFFYVSLDSTSKIWWRNKKNHIGSIVWQSFKMSRTHGCVSMHKFSWLWIKIPDLYVQTRNVMPLTLFSDLWDALLVYFALFVLSEFITVQKKYKKTFRMSVVWIRRFFLWGKKICLSPSYAVWNRRQLF